MAFWKIVGLVVTPTTCCWSISSARLPDVIRLRDRSSSKIATPSSERRFSASVMEIASPTCRISASALGCGDRFPGDVRDVLGSEAEFTEEDLAVRRSTEVLQRNNASRVPDEPVPGQTDTGLDRDARLHRRRQDAVPVPLVLLLEPLHARHGHDPRRDARGLELLACLHRHVHLGTCGDEDDLRLATFGLEADVTALDRVLVGLVRRHALTGQREAVRG